MGIYIHIPFCMKKCKYCDFLSAPAGKETIERYVSRLLGEIESFEGENAAGYPVQSIFFGGGTPSLLPEAEAGQIMEKLYRIFRIEDDAEVTMECNPETVTRKKLEAYKASGINRISFGLQSVHKEELLMLGRIHTYEKFLESYALARNAGFLNINVDLMMALPSQTREAWAECLHRTAALKPDHISAYSLIIEEGTEFYENRNSLIVPDEDSEREMYQDTKVILGEYGYERYEISNYAKPGMESRHNMLYWTGGDYIGFGLGASSLLKGVRFHNQLRMEDYLNSCRTIHENEQKLSEKEQMEEFMFLGLRTMKGISAKEFRARFGIEMKAVYKEILKKHLELGLVETDGDLVKLTEKGIDVSNMVMAEYLLD